MHLEVLVEDQSGTIAVNLLLEKVLGANGQLHSWRTHSYKGIGKLPPDLGKGADPRKRLLLDRLPKLLRGYGKSLRSGDRVLVVVDSDRKDCAAFEAELLKVLSRCDPAPETLFRIAVEEIEAWYLGDSEALLAAYPKAKTSVLKAYVQDSVCGTWELLADAVHPGGSKALKQQGWPAIGLQKSVWARRISEHMNMEANRSPSFKAFREGVRRLVA